MRGDAADILRSIKINEKNTILTPFTIIDRLTNPYAFSKTNKESLNEKSELYFHDISFVPLFMQVSKAAPI
jgi:replication factor C subunit 1